MTDSISLNQFFGYLNQNEGPANADQLETWLAQLEFADGELEPYLRFEPDHYVRNLVFENEQAEVLLLCFEAGQRTPIHDHTNSACGVRVISGVAMETLFEETEDGWLYATGTASLHAGGVVSSTDADKHQLSNLQSGSQRLVTMHVYSPKLGAVGNYSIEDNSVKQVRAKRNRPIETAQI